MIMKETVNNRDRVGSWDPTRSSSSEEVDPEHCFIMFKFAEVIKHGGPENIRILTQLKLPSIA